MKTDDQIRDIAEHQNEDCTFWGELPQDGSKSIEQIDEGFQRLARSISDRRRLFDEMLRRGRFWDFWGGVLIGLGCISLGVIIHRVFFW